MADSDDEYERKKGRDKFKQERRDFDGGRGRTDDRPVQGANYQQQQQGYRKQYQNRQDYYREKYSPQVPAYDGQPPYKRVRREDSGTESADRKYGSGGRYDYVTGDSKMSGSNTLKTFKQFLLEQDDTISEQDALTKYKEYKEGFVRKQLSDFFAAHKNEEWFKEKYHPDFFSDNLQRNKGHIEARLSAFLKLNSLNTFKDKVIHVDNASDLVKFMDSLVILLEGGSEEDFEVLTFDFYSNDPEVNAGGSDSEMPADEKQDSEKPEKRKKPTVSKSKKKRKYSGSDDSSSDSESSSSSSSSGSDSDSDSGEDSDNKEKRLKKKRAMKKAAKKDSGDEDNREREQPVDKDKKNGVEEEKKDDEKKEDGDKEKLVKTEEEPNVEQDANMDSEQPAKSNVEAASSNVADKPVDAPKTNGARDDIDHVIPKRPRPLHRTHSIFLRNLHPSITRQEVEALCKAYPGYLRLALQDPAPERKYFRRGWVTFSYDVNIKEICWNLNNIRLKDCDLGAIVNRELSQRVRPVMTIANHKSVMRQDIKFAAKMIQLLDGKHGLYMDGSSETNKNKAADEGSLAYAIVSKNPLLKNIAEYLVDEGSYEEEALLGGSAATAMGDSGAQEVKIEIDRQLQSVLDKLIFYLRAVHSVDYYSATEYPNEDEMPHRCGIMHARGAVTMPDKVITHRELENYMKEFECKVNNLTQYANRISDEDAKKLGLKSEESVVEAYVQENTKEVAQDKWLCPLSGKKFKGPEFIRKHIFNKHAEKVDAVRKEVEFFNNYLKDPKRPHLAEVRPSGAASSVSSRSGRREDHHERGSDYGGHRSAGYESRSRHEGYPYPAYPAYPYPYPPAAAYRGYPDYRSPPSKVYYERSGNSYYDGGRSYGRQGGYGDYGRNQRGGGGGGGGGGYHNNQDGRTVRVAMPGGRRVLNYTDLDAPEEY